MNLNMDEETIRELLRSQQQRRNEVLNAQLQQQQLQQQQLQQQQEQQRRNSQGFLQQLNQGLGTPTAASASTLLSRARSPVEAPSPGMTGIDLLASSRASSLLSSLANTSPLTSMRSSLSARSSAADNDLSSLAISQEIKRLQQLQQQLTSTGTSASSNAFLHSTQSAASSAAAAARAAASAASTSTAAVDPNSALLQHYLMQKLQAPRFGQSAGALGGNLVANASLPRRSVIGEVTNQSILETQLLQEAQMLMRRRQSVPPSTFAAAASAKAPAPFPVMSTPQHNSEGSRKMRGGVIEPFPEKLHRLLLEVELSGRTDVISFVSEGRAFAIHKSDVFFREIVPLYFRQSRLSSFKRQLNLYGFELTTTGPSRGAYYHELFQRDRPELCRRMRRVAVKVSAAKSSAASGGDSDNEKPSSDDDTSISVEGGADSKLAGVVGAPTAGKQGEEG